MGIKLAGFVPFKGGLMDGLMVRMVDDMVIFRRIIMVDG